MGHVFGKHCLSSLVLGRMALSSHTMHTSGTQSMKTEHSKKKLS